MINNNFRISPHKNTKLPYRSGVGLLIVNNQNKIFVGKRKYNARYWHMPQGGIEKYETDEEAVFREMKEEIGSDKGEIINRSSKLFTYDVPVALIPRLWNGQYRGQSQRWFSIYYTGKNFEINIRSNSASEFFEWKWSTFEEVIKEAPVFKKKLYHEIMLDLEVF